MQDSFVFYRSFYEALTELDAEEYKEAVEGILKYVFEEEVPGFESKSASIIFKLIRPQIDANMKRRVDGAKGGRPKTNGYEKEKPMVMDEASDEKPNVNVNANVNVNVNEDIDKGKNRKRFVPPTKAEIEAYCQETGRKLDADRFIDFYSSKNWMVGKNKMTDWKAAVRNWTRQDVRGCQSSSKIHDYDEREYTEDDYRDLIGI